LAKFFGVLTVVTLFILSLGIFGEWSLPSFYYQSLFLLFISTGGLYYYLVNIREKRPEYFVQIYLLTIAVKLVAYGVYLGIVAWKDKVGVNMNVLFFLIAYVLFTILEVGFLWRKVSR
jgi:hypothetical protein